MLKELLLLRTNFLAVAALVCTVLTPTFASANDDHDHIISIGGSVTEIIFALGEEDRLVARDTTSVYPQAALELPDVGYIRRLAPEGVLSVNPNMIITLEGAGPPEAVEVIKSSDVPFIEVKESYDEDGVISKILAVGKALDVAEKAQKLAESVAADFDKTEAVVSAIKDKKKVLFVLSNNGGKILAAGLNTSAEGMIKMAGAENALTSMEGYKPATDEAILKAAPDVIVMMDRHGGEASGTSGADDILAHPAIAGTPAGQSKSLIKMDGLYLLGYGPRTGQAVLELSRKIYGE